MVVEDVKAEGDLGRRVEGDPAGDKKVENEDSGKAGG